MKYIKSEYYLLKKRLREKRKLIQAIVGPRQVGKTTLITQFMQNEKYLFHFASADSAEQSDVFWISQQWEEARIKLKLSKSKQLILIIDEIQKISAWSEFVKKEWDNDTRNQTNIKVIILGSSSLLIYQGLTESLAGRFEIINMGHWSFTEINKAFNISEEQFVWFGGFPGAYSLIKDEARWKDYIRNSLIEATVAKDILMLYSVKKPALLKRLFDLGCLYSGQIISYNKILGQLQDAGNTVTLSHYLNLLDKAGIITGLQKYSIQPFRQKASSPKFQTYNSAFTSALMEENFKEVKSKPEKWGRAVEIAIGAHLINHAKVENIKVFYWRHVNLEVDFVLKYKEQIIALEVKSGKGKNVKGLAAFNSQFHPKKILNVGRDGIAWEEFLKINPIDLF
ncbi:MAG: ATP-binding protein [Chlorobi bacterium]|nr:ATP-binding protein [Chlorobiota bacterium]